MQTNLTQITLDEVKTGWPKFLTSMVKRVRKRAGITQLTPENLQEIGNAMASYVEQRNDNTPNNEVK
jgi:hypothetical protein